ncbi:MAG: hypothetical protein LBV04_04790, partial [Deferribacteraceae bacterium]|nr:hypothetical protein [Deferribacteraceae bacterium]
MFKKAMLTVLALFMVTNANAVELGVGGGAFIPMGDAKEVYDTGYSADIYMDMHIAWPVTLRILGLYYSADGELNGVNQRLQGIGGGAMLMLKPELGAVQPYIGVGYSALSIRSGSHNSHNQYNSHNKSSESGHGAIGQVG